MYGKLKIFSLVFGILGFSLTAHAAVEANFVRWTAADDSDGSVAHVVAVLSQKLQHPLSVSDFKLIEDRDLAFNHYKRLVQLVDSVPLRNRSIRIWTEIGSDKAIQVEASIAPPQVVNPLLTGLIQTGQSSTQLRALSPAKTIAIARTSVLKHPDDANVRDIDWKDEWADGQLLRVVKVRAKRGYHLVAINLLTRKIQSTQYREYPQADFSIPVQVYPIYEEADDKSGVLPRVKAELRHLLPQVAQVNGDIYAPLKTQRYLETQYDPILGETDAGRIQGYWAMSYLKREAAKIRASLPMAANDWSRGVLLQGLYTSINIHPDAIAKYSPLGFTPQLSAPFLPNWTSQTIGGNEVWEMIPGQAFSGKLLSSAQDAWDRPARRLPDHDPLQYINDGFDEIQVYYAVDTMFTELHSRGFTDPELSTRPFHAFLFNPDISMRDNAFYTDDTINFTTYSPQAQNYARDNSTIWHEMGHGIMDRLMGDSIELADTGGLSEGMADFLADLVVQGVTHGTPFPGHDQFRIINKMGFNLTNEIHDDGEAYGGTMKDFLDAAIAKDGQAGLHKVADLVLEAMRLTRDYPGLTAADWFNHILFADSLGRPGLRAPGELSGLLLGSLTSRNFKLNNGTVASFSIVNQADGAEVATGKPGSRQAPILVNIPKDGSANFALKAALTSSDEFKFNYPVQIRVKYNGGPIQGAVHWVGEENGDQTFTLHSETDAVSIPLEVTGKCDEVNRDDGSCVDFVYVQVWGDQAKQPTAKKRFYLQVRNP